LIELNERLQMTTERDAHGIYHIDGPPYAGFDVVDGNARVEIRYKLFLYVGTKAEVEQAYENLMNLVISELQDLTGNNETGSQYYTGMVRPIIWWRRRVEYSQDPEMTDRWKFRCRFDTTPVLSNDFWDRWATPEGGFARNAKDLQ
jgi:hypothetical protein